MALQTSAVFGVNTNISEESYVNRGDLDEEIKLLLGRNTHIALRGDSKCGKSWLRKRCIPDAIVVQCRLSQTVSNIYEDVFGQLGISVVVEERESNNSEFHLSANSEIGIKILAKIGAEIYGATSNSENRTSVKIGNVKDSLRFFASCLLESGRRLVIEDYHYLSPDQRKSFSFDLKALWDYGAYIVVIGIWSENNLFLHLNPDLSGRVEERSIKWSDAELKKVVEKGSRALNITFSKEISGSIISDSFGTVGIVQTLALKTLDKNKIYESCNSNSEISDVSLYHSAAMDFAEQLNALYQTFANRVASGIRKRSNSTGIYAHILKIIVAEDDKALTSGFSADKIFEKANARESRIQKGNLVSALKNVDKLQVDVDGRGLVFSYDSNKKEVFIVDRQMLFYRKYSTVHWPFEEILSTSGESFEFDGNE